MPTIVRLVEGSLLKFVGDEILPGNIRMSLETAETYSDEDLLPLTLYRTADFIVPEGKRKIGEASYELVEGVAIETYSVEDTPTPVLINKIVDYGVIRFAVTANVVIPSVDYVNIASILRVSAGRYRIYPIENDPDKRLLIVVTLFDATDRKWRITARTPTYIEIRTYTNVDVAADTAEITVYLNKVIQQ